MAQLDVTQLIEVLERTESYGQTFGYLQICLYPASGGHVFLWQHNDPTTTEQLLTLDFETVVTWVGYLLIPVVYKHLQVQLWQRNAFFEVGDEGSEAQGRVSLVLGDMDAYDRH